MGFGRYSIAYPVILGILPLPHCSPSLGGHEMTVSVDELCAGSASAQVTVTSNNISVLCATVQAVRKLFAVS